jgi:hypothetical protein
MPRKQLRNFALTRFVAFQTVNLCYVCERICKQVVDVPEQAFFFAQVPLNPRIQIVLCGTYISIQANVKGDLAQRANL